VTSFIGLPWQHTRGSALLGFVKDDAAWLAQQIATTAAGAPRALNGGAGRARRTGRSQLTKWVSRRRGSTSSR
jgi:hypothetical protein